jgi:acetyl-CoA carboxylase biotin carboxyl carrier protein
MKAKEIQELIDFISKSGLDEVNIETEQFKIKVRKNSEVKHKIIESSTPSPAPPASQSVLIAEDNGASATAADEPASPAKNNGYLEIKSPMIGTFYRSANPDSEPFVSVGDKIDVGQTVCIVEAMKLFNEIESEISGTVVKVLVDNSSPVEYDQPLFLVDPS